MYFFVYGRIPVLFCLIFAGMFNMIFFFISPLQIQKASNLNIFLIDIKGKVNQNWAFIHIVSIYASNKREKAKIIININILYSLVLIMVLDVEIRWNSRNI